VHIACAHRFSQWDDLRALVSEGGYLSRKADIHDLDGHDYQEIVQDVAEASMQRVMDSLTGKSLQDTSGLARLVNLMNSLSIISAEIVGEETASDYILMMKAIDAQSTHTDFTKVEREEAMKEISKMKEDCDYVGVLKTFASMPTYNTVVKMIDEQLKGNRKEELPLAMSSVMSLLDAAKNRNMPWSPLETKKLKSQMDLVVGGLNKSPKPDEIGVVEVLAKDCADFGQMVHGWLDAGFSTLISSLLSLDLTKDPHTQNMQTDSKRLTDRVQSFV
jgi:hypothetical protein